MNWFESMRKKVRAGWLWLGYWALIILGFSILFGAVDLTVSFSLSRTGEETQQPVGQKDCHDCHSVSQ